MSGNSVYYNYDLSNNGVAEHHGKDFSEDYLTDLVLNRTLQFIDENTASEKPMFLTLSTPSSHDPSDSDPKFSSLFLDAKAPRTPAYNATVENGL